MTDKERLEEIKKELELDWSDISYVVNQDDVKWLIEQAGRVQELEEEVDRLNGALHYQLSQENIRNEENRKLKYKNKRYREALKNIYDLAEYDEYDNTLEQIVSEIEKTLEGHE